ncbi:ABC transporter substrate-binding protein [Mesorhizobium sp. M7A.T.Ca.TU.009.01.3.2]|jgi:branched-chain amino acid transport system substrate-binding protein|uniref:ABC transporter substrate-binding protein n=2 Tax=Mesorhizobium TaxID=68287 RepID=UPI000FCBDEC6|nr:MULTISPECIES: ABC transporter substrate-binding protein [unclassified Mesorhizobium]RUU24570.1 ABC transporter substrate-binding protein [Mesorhizobium sp. M7A.T.Ca.TU.009.01.3.2]RUU68208.1 ABC transporter substrate-binding protein [Mesorhizobium sp. M7A.T.Ca.TU.009.01.1.1]RUU79725.1 ABC transporter substrate-binding protein [Mesorhizobium sp. M7A.T.Ca.TU.009.01.1.2]RUT89296.1 ABC transporter substrate-binding protein [Mesorhizobium sp. M7A.T.Ca.US.000.02.1.1]RUT93093.1 ABC transporter subs
MTYKMRIVATALASMSIAYPALADDKTIVIGFATAESGFMEAYDKPAQEAALIRIDEINAAGGLLGKQIKVVKADTKSDRAEGAKAGLSVLDQGADLVVVSCDYDFGSPAALAAEDAGRISFFLCAESVKAGIQGVGPHSFSASVLAAVQGATMAEWAFKEKGAKDFYRLLDTWTAYNKGICDGFDWMMPKLEAQGAKLVGEDTFKNEDASIAAQITRIKSLPKEPDAIMLCTMMPGAVSAIKQLRAAGINSMILNGSGVDGSYWLSAVPDLTNFYVPVQGSIYGDDPNPAVLKFNATYKAKTGADPSSQYVFPGYVMVDVWAKAVERAGTADADAVVAELEKMKNEPTLFGPRTFSPELHHQNQTRYLIVETKAGKPGVVGNWTISEPVPMEALLK